MKKIAFIALLATTAFTPAIAADLGRPVYKAPVAIMAPVTNWNGFYIGGHAGYGWGDADYRFNNVGWYNLTAGDRTSHDMSGLMAGGQIGFNWQAGRYVYGLEVAGTWSDVRRTVTSPILSDV